MASGTHPPLLRQTKRIESPLLFTHQWDDNASTSRHDYVSGAAGICMMPAGVLERLWWRQSCVYDTAADGAA